jgi:hypothetical protein
MGQVADADGVEWRREPKKLAAWVSVTMNSSLKPTPSSEHGQVGEAVSRGFLRAFRHVKARYNLQAVDSVLKLPCFVQSVTKYR